VAFADGFCLATRTADATDWPPGNVERLHVVAFDDDSDLVHAGPVFTLSWSPNVCGWETDASRSGYGLPLHVAREIADAYNHSHRPA
jgi:hypothetical protein